MLRSFHQDLKVAKMQLKEIIADHAADLPPQLRQAADFIAANPIEVSFRSMRSIAERTGLAPPTFSRLARSLGFNNYEGLREACRIAAKDAYSGYRERAEALRVGHAAGSDDTHFHVAYGQQSMRNINETMVNADTATVERVADAVLGARRVFVNAQMGQRHIGSYAGYVSSLAFDNWEVLGVEPSSIASQVRKLTSEDVMICLSVMPYATGTLALAKAAQSSGTHIIAITDTADSPIAALADDVLLAATANRHFFASQLGVLYLLEVIIGLMVAKSGDSIQSNLEKTELFSTQTGEYIER